MRRGMRPLELSYGGRSATIDMPGWYCDASDESVHSGADMKVSDRELTRLKAEADGLLTPEAVRGIRKKLGLTQRQAGALVGGGPNAFQKYESGEILPSRAVTTALRLLELHPEALARLRQQRSPA